MARKQAQLGLISGEAGNPGSGFAGPYGGYGHLENAEEDKELTHVLQRTPAGEYLRRFWQPVALVSQLGDMPLPVRVLGEDLVLFRSRKGELGLLHRHCLHRRASLEYGRIEEEGLRCCYHGWLFGKDGQILETPGEPANSTLRQRLWQPAYPTREFAGLVFAYLGPPERVPPFPIIDNFQIPGSVAVPYAFFYPCNWLQVAENSFDSAHVAFLHILHGKPQFSENLGIVPTLRYYKRKIGLYHAQARRIGENVMVSSKDIIFPNITQAGATFTANGEQVSYFGRSGFSRWVVPLDNTSTMVFAVAHFNERSDPFRPEYMAPERLEVLESGAIVDRPEIERRRNPGDREAIGSQGPIAVHALEHLAATDAGVALYRRQLKKAIRGLAQGSEPPPQTAEGNDPLCTYGGMTVLRIPVGPETGTPDFLRTISDRIVEIYVAGDKAPRDRRDETIKEALRALEQSYA